MKPRKKEIDALATLLVQGADTPEDLVKAFIDRYWELLAERKVVFASAEIVGRPVTIGPFATANQAQRAIEDSRLASKFWVVDGWTEAGWQRHLEELDAVPKKRALSADEQRERDKKFWPKTMQIRNGEHTAIIGRNRQDIEIKPFHMPKGVW